MASGQIIAIGGGGTGQSAGVSNSGTGTANSGGNAGVGNASINGAGTAQAAPATGGSLLGGLLSAPVNLGSPANNSTGSATTSTGGAAATGNQAGTSVNQGTSGGGGGTGPRVLAAPAQGPGVVVVPGFFAPASEQSAGVSNAGSATANTGGNSGVGNASRNAAGITQSASGGLIGAAVNIGSPTNNSTGSSNITTGPASATGNESGTAINQGIGGGGGACGSRSFSPFSPFFFSNQDAQVRNTGQATANTGGNSGVGNASQNAAGTTQSASGGLIGLTLNLGSPTNTSGGTSNIATGPATAVGNESTTSVNQQCGADLRTVLPVVRPSVVVVPTGVPRVAQVQQAALARTGMSAADLTAMAGLLLSFGASIVVAQRRRLTPRPVGAAPFAGLGLGADDWDRVVTR
jgi:hypothetical protein